MMLLRAGSLIHLKATVINSGNVYLRKLTLTPRQYIPVDQSFTCTISDISSTDLATVTWQLAEDVAPGKTVECLGSYALGQDWLEAAAVINGSAPQLLVFMQADYEVTDAATKLSMGASAQITVVQNPGAEAQILQGSCQVPDGPGADGHVV
jgi:hypothetical protein